MGPLIAISGIDGAGKTTQTARLTSYLQARDPRTTQVKTRLTAQQGIFALAEALYGDPFDYHPQIPATLREFTLACDILAWSRDTLAPLRATGAPVVWDRSPLCYETYARVYGADMTWPLRLLALVEQPDLVVLLDLPAELSVQRLAGRGDGNQADESLELLAEVRALYLALASERPNVVVVDATAPEGEVTAELARLADGLVSCGS